MPTVLYSCGAMIFVSTIMTRLLDPLVPAIAADLAVGITSVALLATAFSIIRRAEQTA